ncbi:hypothetical protein FRC12_006156 [Ceratobasidium sp. 428]|nr:hypothetical protein FRC12_006156 [Ceratobasidium sp. 428]
MAAPTSSSFFQRRKSQYAQYGPPWSASLWTAAFVATLLDHLFCLSMHQKHTLDASQSYVTSVQRIFSLFIELCLISSNTASMFHILYRSSRRKPELSNLPSYITPIITFLLLTGINVALIGVPIISKAALATMSPSDLSSETYYFYAPSILFLTYGVALSLVGLGISASSVLAWGFAQSSDEPLPRGEFLGLNWDGQNGASRV